MCIVVAIVNIDIVDAQYRSTMLDKEVTSGMYPSHLGKMLIVNIILKTIMRNNNSRELEGMFEMRAPAPCKCPPILSHMEIMNPGNLDSKVHHLNLTWNDYNTIRRGNCNRMRSRVTTLRWRMHMHSNGLQSSPSQP